MIEFEAARPIGVRTCCDLPRKSGEHQHVWLIDDVDKFSSEYEDLKAGRSHSQLTRPQHIDALGVIRSLMNKAARGQLEVGTTSAAPARVIRRVEYLLELRPPITRRAGRRLFRLYYAEPEVRQGTLLPLVLATKPNGPDENEEQNEAIDDAKARSRVWTLYGAGKVTS